MAHLTEGLLTLHNLTDDAGTNDEYQKQKTKPQYGTVQRNVVSKYQ